ncbi:MAG: hypothetical protein N2109_02605 [Fimbriimonadales bacterium]|nr:hypothetical protein [Fimbriimonadales bacterium]
MTGHQRVLASLNRQPIDRVPMDLGGMRSTGISCFAYPGLRRELGLPEKPPLVEDTHQMLALPERDVLDALDVDVVTILDGVTNAFEQPELWRDYDFGGRLRAKVRHPENFRTEPDGTVVQGSARMVPGSYVFDVEHAGQPLNLDDLPPIDVEAFREEARRGYATPEEADRLAELCRRVRESTDRAVFLNDWRIGPGISIHGFDGLAIFPMRCLLEPHTVRALHEILTERALHHIRLIAPRVRGLVDVAMVSADDWGTQQSLIAGPETFRSLFLPYYRACNDAWHAAAPETKTFLHSCGAIHPLIPLIAEAGFDVLNPVQWTAGGRTAAEWKASADQAGIALWGGGMDSQATLPLGTVEDVERVASESVRKLSAGGGYVFCNIHNVLAEVEPRKVVAMYRAARSVRPC